LDRLGDYGIKATAVHSRNQPSVVRAVAVCTPSGLAHPPVRVEWLDLVIVLNAPEITSKLGMECIGPAERAQLFGLLEWGERPAPLDRPLQNSNSSTEGGWRGSPGCRGHGKVAGE
jgi:hypothetical protein